VIVLEARHRRRDVGQGRRERGQATMEWVDVPIVLYTRVAHREPEGSTHDPWGRTSWCRRARTGRSARRPRHWALPQGLIGRTAGAGVGLAAPRPDPARAGRALPRRGLGRGRDDRAGGGGGRGGERLARLKAAAVARSELPPILGADTWFVCEGQMLGKPASPDEARQMLRRLSGRTHEVVTGLCLVAPHGTRSGIERTAVTFGPMSPEEIDGMSPVASRRTRAGAYHVDGKGALFVSSVTGSPSNVSGLPVRLFVRLARRPTRLGFAEIASPRKEATMKHCAAGWRCSSGKRRRGGGPGAAFAACPSTSPTLSLSKARTRSISPKLHRREGQGGMPSREPGRTRRAPGAEVEKCRRREIGPETTFTLAQIDGTGAIQHIWMTPTGNWRFSTCASAGTGDDSVGGGAGGRLLRLGSRPHAQIS